MMDVDVAAGKTQQPQPQQQHVWSSAATAYEALSLVRAALEDPSSSSSAFTRPSFAALRATLQTAADAYLSHLVPPTSSRHQRLTHERSRFHVSRTQMANTLAQGFQLPLRGSKDVGPLAPASSTAATTVTSAASSNRNQIAIPRALSQQLYAALHQLHPSRPAQPPDPDPPASTLATTGGAPADTKPSAPSNLSLPINPAPQAPSPRTSPALATLALTSLSNILTSPARSLFPFEVFAEHFDLDRASAGGTGGAAGAASPAGGVTSPSVAVSPAVMPPETADGGRAVSVIMIGGTVLVVDIEVGIKDWSAPGSTSESTSKSPASEAVKLPAWAKEKCQLSWLPSVHVKITFATAPSTNTDAANGQSEAQSTSSSESDPTALGKLLRRHIEVLAQLLLLGFPLDVELRQDQGDIANGDGDVVMSEAAGSQPEAADAETAPSFSSSRHDKSADLLHTALQSEANARAANPQGLDPALAKTHMGLYGEEYYLLAHHHLQAFIHVLGRLAQLDKERAESGTAPPTAAA